MIPVELWAERLLAADMEPKSSKEELTNAKTRSPKTKKD
jgi:hypothetical protein